MKRRSVFISLKQQAASSLRLLFRLMAWQLHLLGILADG
jgi:hypothetical protein